MTLYNLGALGNTAQKKNNLTVTATAPDDVFKFTLSEKRKVNLLLTDIHDGDPDMELYRDTDNDGVLDRPGDQLITSSTVSGLAEDYINQQLDAGTYFARVFRYALGSDTSVRYDLYASATDNSPLQTTAPNLLSSEVQLGDLSGDVTRTGSISSTNTVDNYYFSLGLYEGVEVRLTGLASNQDLDIRLIEDDNANRIADASEVVAYSRNGGSADDVIAQMNRSGNFILQVYQYGDSSSSYNLTFDHRTTTFA